MLPFKIGIERLCIAASVGIYDFEKSAQQDIFISAYLFFNDSTIDVDSMASSHDYDVLSNAIKSTVAARHYELIENMALCVAKDLKKICNAARVQVKIEKPLAAEKNSAQNIFVEIEI